MIVVDTNVFIGACQGQSASNRLIALCIQGRVTPVMGSALMLEYEDVMARREVLERCPLPEEERRALIDGLLSRCELVEVYCAWRPNLRDEGDNHVFELAVAAGSAPLLTYNVRDFAHPQLKFPNLQILSPAQWLQTNRS